MMRRWILLFCVTALSYAAPAHAQLVDSLGPEVRKYLRVSTPKVILEHVQIIDGTGTAPIADRNITIEGGKIAAISPGADPVGLNGNIPGSAINARSSCWWRLGSRRSRRFGSRP
jgi:hypothetical protein